MCAPERENLSSGFLGWFMGRWSVVVVVRASTVQHLRSRTAVDLTRAVFSIDVSYSSKHPGVLKSCTKTKFISWLNLTTQIPGKGPEK